MTLAEIILSAIASAIIGATGGAWAASYNLNNRLSSVELKVAEKYVSKEELNQNLRKFEEHLIRIEGKFDALILNQSKDG